MNNPTEGAPVPLSPNQAEVNRDKLNLRPALEFVEQNLEIYQQKWQEFLAKPEDPESRSFADKIEMGEYEKTNVPEITDQDARNIIARIPYYLLQHSRLQLIDYFDNNKLPVPKFEPDGSFKGRAELVEASAFPRPEDHPHRVLIGNTWAGGEVVGVTALPATLSESKEARDMYQRWVLTHELFHTIEIYSNVDKENNKPPQNRQERAEEIIINKEQGRTLANWSKDYAAACQAEPLPSSIYAGVYEDQIEKDGSVDPFSFAIREYEAEDWVGYILGILPNKDGVTEFKDRIPPRRYELLEELFTATR